MVAGPDTTDTHSFTQDSHADITMPDHSISMIQVQKDHDISMVDVFEENAPVDNQWDLNLADNMQIEPNESSLEIEVGRDAAQEMNFEPNRDSLASMDIDPIEKNPDFSFQIEASAPAAEPAKADQFSFENADYDIPEMQLDPTNLPIEQGTPFKSFEKGTAVYFLINIIASVASATKVKRKQAQRKRKVIQDENLELDTIQLKQWQKDTRDTTLAVSLLV